MSSMAQKNPYRKPYNFKTTYMTVNQRMYHWADNLFFNELISASVLHTLKAIIATRHMKQPTFKQINEARTRSASLKFAQSDAVSEKTIERHIQKLEQLKHIKVTRDKSWLKTRNSYFINVPSDLLVKARTDIMSVSLSCSSSSQERGGGATTKRKKQSSIKSSSDNGAIAPLADGRALAPTSTLEPETTEEKQMKRERRRTEMKLVKSLLSGEINERVARPN